ncbi:c-type cytochrome [Singulisphaera sp. PoT]|uniref:c-type cytochrome n=1 Tax=Singulisphaera sp. PoT TaxID=3411797 RepID=UPI003BF57590
MLKIPKNSPTRPRAWWLVAGLVLLAGCAENEMDKQPKIQRPYQVSSFFSDGRSARPLVAGTVARGQLRTDTAYYAGKSGEQFIDEIPRKVDASVLAFGRERFNIYCAPCHSRTGDGQGMIVKRGFSPPPSLHLERLRDAPAGHFYNVITNGYGAMYSYASRIPVDDRWAIVAYIRALQLSQNARIDDVPAEKRTELEAAAR